MEVDVVSASIMSEIQALKDKMEVLAAGVTAAVSPPPPI